MWITIFVVAARTKKFQQFLTCGFILLHLTMFLEQVKGKLVRASEDTVQAEMFAARQEIVSALVHLGFRMADVEKVVAQMEPDTDVQAGVRMGLSALTN